MVFSYFPIGLKLFEKQLTLCSSDAVTLRELSSFLKGIIHIYICIYIVTIRKLSLGYFLLKDRYKKKKKKYLSIRINLVWTLLIPSLFTRVFQLSIKRFNDAWIFNLLLPAVCYGNQADVRFGATGRRHIGLHLRLVFTKFLIKRWSIEREWNFVRSPLF